MHTMVLGKNLTADEQILWKFLRKFVVQIRLFQHFSFLSFSHFSETFKHSTEKSKKPIRSLQQNAHLHSNYSIEKTMPK